MAGTLELTPALGMAAACRAMGLWRGAVAWRPWASQGTRTPHCLCGAAVGTQASTPTLVAGFE